MNKKPERLNLCYSAFILPLLLLAGVALTYARTDKLATGIARQNKQGPLKQPVLVPLEVLLLNPSHDPLQRIANDSSSSGRLVYVMHVPKSDGGPLLLLRDIGKPAALNANAVSNATVTYRIKTELGVFDPHWAPNGRSILFKIGSRGDRHSSYQLFLWDLKKKFAVPISTDDLEYESTFWSPDSHFIAYVKGGDIEGNVESGERLKLFIYDAQKAKSYLLFESPPDLLFKIGGWTPQGTLFISAPAEIIKRPVNNINHQDITPPLGQNKEQMDIHLPERPNIYLLNANAPTGRLKLVIADGYAPMPSPDGKWIAFCGWPDSVQRNSNNSGTQDAEKSASASPDKRNRRIIQPGCICIIWRTVSGFLSPLKQRIFYVGLPIVKP